MSAHIARGRTCCRARTRPSLDLDLDLELDLPPGNRGATWSDTQVHRGLPGVEALQPTPRRNTMTESVQSDTTSGASTRLRARAIVEAVYEERRPRPLARRRDADALAERCLHAGWLDDEVRAAMVAVGAITWVAVEVELRRRAGQLPPSTMPQASTVSEGPLPGVPMCPHCANTGRICRHGTLYECDHQGGFR